MQKCSDAEVLKSRGAGAELQGAEAQRCRGAEVQSCIGSEEHRCRGAEVQRCRRADGDAGADEVMQRDMVCRETDMEMLRYRGAELQRC